MLQANSLSERNTARDLVCMTGDAAGLHFRSVAVKCGKVLSQRENDYGS